MLGYFRDLEVPRIERSKRRQWPGHRIHCHLCRNLQRGLPGLRGDVRQEQGGVVTLLSWTCPTESHPTTHSATCSPGGDPEQFQRCFVEGSHGLAELLPGEVVAIDGKTLGRSHDKSAGKRAIHPVSAWATPELAEGLPGIPEHGSGEWPGHALGCEGRVPSGDGVEGASVQTRYYISSLAKRRRSGNWQRCGVTGASRTHCTGPWM